MGELLLEMNKEYSMTLILATHSIDIANKMSKKLHLVDGKLISE
jgi:predicted ABC-type transport system involved in lysophospholipase L1 biosynthesis ATPase subunit